MISLSKLAGMENVKISQQVFLLHFQNLREMTTILDKRQAQTPRDGNQQWNVDPT